MNDNKLNQNWTDVVSRFQRTMDAGANQPTSLHNTTGTEGTHCLWVALPGFALVDGQVLQMKGDNKEGGE